MSKPFKTFYQEVIFKTRYARWIPEENRREDWDETVLRLVEYYCKKIQPVDIGEIADVLYYAIYDLKVMPSMRALMTCGPTLDRCHVPAYNCAYTVCDSPRAFDETMYILMCGTGVGFSVERKYVEKLPVVSETMERTDTCIKVADSKEGWAKAFRELLSLLWAGQIPSWDVSSLRPAGARLKTFGGRASGPDPLVRLFEFCVDLFQKAKGRRLSTLECHDLMCMVADVVVVGGVRRSAMISLSDVDDDRMRDAKTGAWWTNTLFRQLANNSAVYSNRKPDPGFFLKEWKALYDSKSGERGIFSRFACQKIVNDGGRRNPDFEFGTNPCSEIILRPNQFCNLTEVVVRSGDTFDELKRKVEIATILGTIQSTFTDFGYLRKVWRDNCEEERLLGVSLTGICDNLELLTDENLEALKAVAVETNKIWAERLGINPSAAITCVKPSGTVSQLVDAASGIHTRHSPFYLRSIRADNKDPVTEFLKAQGFPNEPEFGKEGSSTVFYFPIKSPENSITRDDQTAIEALELWKKFQVSWCEHKPSVTISVKEDEWLDVGAWCFKNFDLLSGVSFLPFDGGTYKQAPYQEISKEEYEDLLSKMPPDVDWSVLSEFEFEDSTTGTQELACSAGVCEIVNIGAEDG